MILDILEENRVMMKKGNLEEGWIMGKREMPAKEHRTQRRPQDSRKSQDNRRPRDSRRTQDSRNHREIEDRKKAGGSWRKFTIIRQNPWQEIEEDQELTKNHRKTEKKL